WQALSRITSSGMFIPTLDGLRFAAICSVVLYHLADSIAAKSPYLAEDELRSSLLFGVLDKGSCGVQLFFIISGFILALPFAEHCLAGRPSVSLPKYYRRRVTRLVPPYLCNLVVALAIQVLAGRGTVPSLWPHFLASAFYIHNLTYGEMSLINGVAWSLEVEVQFYILAPMMAKLFAISSTTVRRGSLLCAIVTLAAVKSCVVAAGGPSVFWHGTIVWFLEFFLTGFLLADLYVAAWNRSPARSWQGDLIGLTGWGLVLASQYDPVMANWMALPALAAYIGAFRGNFWHRLFSNPWYVAVGGMCYTIYLYHFFIIAAVERATLGLAAGTGFSANFVLQSALICPVVLVISAVLFLLFEKPFMKPAVRREAQPATTGA
ncbi:MAG TPA: acyltransferase, partial [Planctomycetaceae bacterium]